MWPCTTNVVSGVDFTLFMASEALSSMPLAARNGADTGDVLNCLRIPTTMRAAFELLSRTFPEEIRALHQRQNWQLVRDGFCLRAPSVVPQGIGYPTAAAEGPTPDDDDFVNEDVPVRTGLGTWESNGDFRYFAADDPRLGSTYRTHKEYPRNPWTDAMSTPTKSQVRRMLDGWRMIVDERNRTGMYLPVFVLPAETTASQPIPRTRYFGQFYHRSPPQPVMAPPQMPPLQPPQGGPMGRSNNNHNASYNDYNRSKRRRDDR